MMRLRTAKASPFGRKCWMAALRLQLMDQIELNEADYLQPHDPLHQENPLGKMPVLTTHAGTHLYDSRVILEYLDHLVSGVIMPAQWSERLDHLRWQALCDGIMDAGVLIVMEQRQRPPAARHQPFVEFQRQKIVRGLQALDRAAPNPTVPYVGAIALACTLGFLDRRKQFDWRRTYPRLTAWLETFRAATPEYDATHVPPDPTFVSL